MLKLSIIVPIYNAKKYINECMLPILNELNSEVEVLLLDDGSTDNTYSFIRKYESDNIHLFQHSNHGVSYTRNRGIKEAKGDYIMFVDSDDCLCSNWLENILKELEKGKDIYYFSKDCKNKQFTKKQIIDNLFQVKTEAKIRNFSAPWSKVFKRDFLIKNNIFFDETLINGEDSLFNLHCIVNTDSFECVGTTIYSYRIYSGSSTKKFNPKFFDSNLDFFRIAKEYMTIGNIKAEDQERYIKRSVIYSIYLYLFLVSKIKNKEKRKNALNRLLEPEMQNYIQSFENSMDCNIVVNLIYKLVKNKFTLFAILLIKIRNILKNKKSNLVIWEEN